MDLSNLPTNALSIRQPWASLIMAGLKDIENRTWSTNRRGSIFLHVGQAEPTKKVRRHASEVSDLACHKGLMKPSDAADAEKEFSDRGGLIGIVDIVDCVTESESPWFEGKYGLVLANPRPITFIPLKGKLSFFTVPDPVREQVQINDLNI